MTRVAVTKTASGMDVMLMVTSEEAKGAFAGLYDLLGLMVPGRIRPEATTLFVLSSVAMGDVEPGTMVVAAAP